MKNKTLYDFFGACRIVAGTDRMIKQDGGDWVKLIYDELESGRGALRHLGGKLYWPAHYEQKQKTWEVEPEEKKERWIFRGFGVLGVASGEIIVKTREGQYEKEDGFRIPPEIFEKIPEWFEKIEDVPEPTTPKGKRVFGGYFKGRPQWFEKIEDVDIESEKKKEIYVWGACDNDGFSEYNPEIPTKHKGSWRGQALYGDLFPSDTPVKMELKKKD